MIEIGGKCFIVDLDNLGKLLSDDESLTEQEMEETETKVTFDPLDLKKLNSKELISKKYIKGKELDMTKYEMVRMFMEVLLTYNEEVDDSLGWDKYAESTPFPFRISFNTLLSYGILKEIEY